jgi:hypothetical protein
MLWHHRANRQGPLQHMTCAAVGESTHKKGKRAGVSKLLLCMEAVALICAVSHESSPADFLLKQLH